MTEISKDLIQENAQLIKELHETIEAKSAESAESKVKVEKLEKRLDELEDVNQKRLVEIESSKKTQKDFEEKLVEMEKQASRLPAGSAKQASVELKAFEKFLMKGERSLNAEEVKYLRTDNDSDGGFLSPPEYVNEIIKKITEISPVRQVARVMQTGRESVQIPKRETLLTGFWTGEGGDIATNQSTYGLQEIKTNKLSTIVEITREMMADSFFNMEQEITSDAAESFAQLEGAAFISGDAVNKPQGILTNPDVQEVNTGVANDLTADSLIDMTGELKVGYSRAWMFNRGTLARIRKLKDGAGAYLWHMFDASAPNTLLGDPYFVAQDLPDIAVDSNPVIYGDFNRGYRIVDRMSMDVIRDDFTLATSGKIRFIFNRRVGAQVVLAEAIKKMKIAV